MTTNRMRWDLFLFAVIAAWLLPLGALADEAEDQPDASRLVTEALQAELDGRNAARQRLLTRALQLDPEHPLGNWQNESVQAPNSTWVNFREIPPTRKRVLDEYRDVRSTAGNTIKDHLRLADWCRDQALSDSERAHLRQVLALDPDHAHARQRLGYQKLFGLWISSDELALAAARQNDIVESLKNWGPTIQENLRLLSGVRRQRDRGREQLFSIRDTAAIPAMERLLATGSESSGLLLIEWLSRLNAYEAAQAIARTALVAPHDSVRRAAAEALRSRPYDEFMPVLLGALRTPVKSETRTHVNSHGWVVLELLFDAEAQEERYQLKRTAEISSAALRINLPGRNSTVFVEPRSADRQDVQAVRKYIRDTEREAAFARLRWNGLIRQTNVRAEMVLQHVTQLRDLKGPGDWWDWWNEYNEVHVKGVKPLRRVERGPEYKYVSDQTKKVSNPEITFNSCLVAGTPVWTELGLMPIEQIEVGDRVLAQDVGTGELAYKPVLATTERPPARTFRILTEDVQLRATGGHPFWVNGTGWRFARDLQPDICLHGTDGSRAVNSVEPAEEAAAFNLVVADFHSYFIGAGQILSHDNTPRAPTNALIPGLDREP